ncbi:NAD-dependent epimerase/dehydratase family protein [Candidatus Fermentibacteria bacterium]|nr:NAD-dependent epimerase/dehydratase family protein [Candidatus Fermentibacteria bacterium]
MLYVVSGAAGFVGSNLTDRLLSEGHRVIGVDCFRDYYDPRIKRRNLSRAIARKTFQLLELDLSRDTLEPLEQAIGSRTFIVYHLSAQAGVRKSWGRSFQHYVRDNVQATQRLLEWCKGRENLQNLVYSSSSSVYGNVDSMPMREDTSIPRPYSPYGVTKLAGEHLVHLYGANYGMPWVACRLFTVYGPRQRPDMAFSRFIEAAMEDRPITIFGDGKQARDFTYVGDIVEGFRRVETIKDREVINLGRGERVRLLEVLSALSEILGKHIEVEYVEDQKGDVRDTWASVDKARKLLGWEPEVDIFEGLAGQVEWTKTLSKAKSRSVSG